MALHVGQAARPADRRTFSKRRFPQPQRRAIFGLMRYEDWTFRETEVRLAEHTELRMALGLRHVPDDTTGYRCLRRLAEAALEQTVHAVVQRLVRQPGDQATVAVDATGLAPGAVSTCFVKRANERGEGFTWRPWLKWAMAVAVDRRVMVAQPARRGPPHDCATRRPRIDAAHQRVPLGLVLADAEFARERNQQPMRQTLQAQRVIPAKRGGAAWRIQGGRAQRRQEFPAHLSRRRVLIASLLSAVKRQLSARAPGRSLQTQGLQALLLAIAFNIYRLWRFALLRVLRMATEPGHHKIVQAI
jgi:hypothetical protein